MLVCISCRLGQNFISKFEAKLELWTPKDTQLNSGFAINRTRTRNEMQKSTHGVVDYFIKTMLRNEKNALFLHDIAQATWGRCIFNFYRKILQNSKHLPSIYNSKVTVNFFSGHPVFTLHHYIQWVTKYNFFLRYHSTKWLHHIGWYINIQMFTQE